MLPKMRVAVYNKSAMITGHMIERQLYSVHARLVERPFNTMLYVKHARHELFNSCCALVRNALIKVIRHKLLHVRNRIWRFHKTALYVLLDANDVFETIY